VVVANKGWNETKQTAKKGFNKNNSRNESINDYATLHNLAAERNERNKEDARKEEAADSNQPTNHDKKNTKQPS
jgi:hypothetical protein